MTEFVIPVHTNFDATEKVEVVGEVRTAGNEGMPIAVYCEDWKLEMYATLRIAQDVCSQESGHECDESHTWKHAGSE